MREMIKRRVATHQRFITRRDWRMKNFEKKRRKGGIPEKARKYRRRSPLKRAPLRWKSSVTAVQYSPSSLRIERKRMKKGKIERR
jgi:hypothetical protein